MKFSKIIWCKMRTNFLEKICAKCGGEASSRLFYEKSNLSNNSSSTTWNVTKFVFIACVSRGIQKYIKN